MGEQCNNGSVESGLNHGTVPFAMDESLNGTVPLTGGRSQNATSVGGRNGTVPDVVSILDENDEDENDEDENEVNFQEFTYEEPQMQTRSHTQGGEQKPNFK